jgi:hypothetical protein
MFTRRALPATGVDGLQVHGQQLAADTTEADGDGISDLCILLNRGAAKLPLVGKLLHARALPEGQGADFTWVAERSPGVVWHGEDRRGAAQIFFCKKG